MRCTILLLALFTSIATAAPPPLPADPLALTRDADLMRSFAGMVESAGRRMRGTEAGVFLLRQSDGRYALHPWSWSEIPFQAHFEGLVPLDAVAVVHTHPPAWNRPSHQDVEEARRLGMPVFAVSRWNIWLILPGVDQPLHLARYGWKQTAERDEGPTGSGPRMAESAAPAETPARTGPAL
jgi:hypothetical protein